MAGFACLKLRKTEPGLNRPYKVNGGKAGILAAIAAGLIIILLMVVPMSPAALKPVEWIITIVWIVVGFAIFFIFGKPSATKDPSSQAASPTNVAQ